MYPDGKRNSSSDRLLCSRRLMSVKSEIYGDERVSAWPGDVLASECLLGRCASTIGEIE